MAHLPHYLFNFEYTMLKVHTLVYYLFNLEYKMHKVHTLLTRLSLAAPPLQLGVHDKQDTLRIFVYYVLDF